jgi:hypothetical protein
MCREMRTLSNWVAANILFGNEDFAASIQIGKEIEQWLALDARACNNFFSFDALSDRTASLARGGPGLLTTAP